MGRRPARCFNAETVNLLFTDAFGLRASRTAGVTAGEFHPDGTFRPLTPVAPYLVAEARERLVPYLSAEVQRVGDRWDAWFDHRHVSSWRDYGRPIEAQAYFERATLPGVAGGHLPCQPDSG